ncbi:MAG: acyl-protein synthetase [Bilifractor sp.]
MNLDELLKLEPYSLSGAEKEIVYQQLMPALSAYHAERCPAYAAFLRAFSCDPGRTAYTDIPPLPTGAFKQMDLKSIHDEEVYKVVTSSATTGTRPSRIYLDAATSARQQVALYKILSDFMGTKRRPYLVLDTGAVFRNRQMFSARGAGILGFSLMASSRCYALDEKMELDLPAVERFLEDNVGRPVLLFGFTYMIWKYFVLPMEKRGLRLALPPGSLLVHGGGWKKMQEQAVSEPVFNERVRGVLGEIGISDYYGMAEQTGCIMMECAYGHMHVSNFSEVLVRDPIDHHLLPDGERGILEVLSPLPSSYPGHLLLTEDMGRILGEDDCPCGRKGKYIRIEGRIPRSEVRGCSDTYQG